MHNIWYILVCVCVFVCLFILLIPCTSVYCLINAAADDDDNNNVIDMLDASNTEKLTLRLV